ncbi:MAG: methyl-accepting chemotaxis protein [Pseudomonadota bacterium]
MLNALKISHRLWLMTGLAGLLFLIAVAVGWHGLSTARDALKGVYEDRTVAMYTLSRIDGLQRENNNQVLLSFQHDPSHHLSVVHDHPTALHFDAIAKNRAEIGRLWAEYMKTHHTEAEARLAETLTAKRKAAGPKLDSTVEAMRQGDFSTALLADYLRADADRQAVQVAMNDLLKVQMDIARAEYEAAEQRYAVDKWIFLILTLVGVVGVAGSAWMIIGRIRTSLSQAAAAAHAIAGGDLTYPLPAAGSDEVGQLVGQLGEMQRGLRDLIGHIRDNVEAVTRSASELTSAAAQTSEISRMQSDDASGMAAGVEQLSVSIDQVEEHSREARELSQSSASQSSESGRIIHEATSEISHIADQVNAMAVTIRELEGVSGQISTIVAVIRDIADQTNLLALNAAIEAARAGEQGRGFAVVADEVRKLAERTAKSTQEIADMIAKIQQGTQRATQEMEAGVSRVNGGVELARQAGDSVSHIRTAADQVNHAMDGISTAIREQAAAMREIAGKVERIAQGAEENSASVSQTAAAAGRLESLARDLHAQTERFRL